MDVPKYLRDYSSFYVARMSYYSSKTIGNQELQIAKRIERQTPKKNLSRVGDTIEQISVLSPKYIIVTSTKDRKDKIMSSYEKICEQDY